MGRAYIEPYAMMLHHWFDCTLTLVHDIVLWNYEYACSHHNGSLTS